MKVPAEILAVPRPQNTVVGNSGRPGPKQYPVRGIATVKYIDGMPFPVSGMLVGYIVDSKFVPLEDGEGGGKTKMLSYGASALIHEVLPDIIEDLFRVTSPASAMRIVIAACIRVMNPELEVRHYADFYNRTFLSVYYPGLSMAANTMEYLLVTVGMDAAMRQNFLHCRLSRLADDAVGIDAIVRQRTVFFDSLSDIAFRQYDPEYYTIPVVYAYDIRTREILFSEAFPDNPLNDEVVAYFVRENGIPGGMVVSDRDFASKELEDKISPDREFSFIRPVSLDDERIEKYEMLTPEFAFDAFEKSLLGKKQELPDGHFLYCFQDEYRGLAAYHAYKQESRKNGSLDFQASMDVEKNGRFLVLETDRDLDAKDVFCSYEERRMLGIVLEGYGNRAGMNKFGDDRDFAVIGSEFVTLIASVITCRIIERLRKAGLLKKESYRNVMDDLFSVTRDAEHADDAVENDDHWGHVIPGVMRKMVSLGLTVSSKPAKASKKRKAAAAGADGSGEDKTAGTAAAGDANSGDAASENADQPKRKRGRTRKAAAEPEAEAGIPAASAEPEDSRKAGKGGRKDSSKAGRKAGRKDS